MLFSVLISVYGKDCPRFLDEALESIYDHQTLKPSEIILVEDGPLNQDLSKVVVKWKNYLGDTLVIVKNKVNLGLAGALNVGLEYCSHELVARMDSDDISRPDRFEIQVDFMTKNPHICASSGQVIEYDLRVENVLGNRQLPLTNEELKKFCRTRSPLSHPAVIFRKTDISVVGGYPRFSNSQDWALWSLLLSKGKLIANVEEPLLHMRTDNSLYNRRGAKYYFNELKIFRYQKDLGIINYYYYIFNVVSKGFLRLSPDCVKKLAYGYFR
ncbi:glycosyltransferase [Vibrio natriegens]|uniref:glycosyltransferase n=1 Tax=Vibrio natriegens TaxID=691 RepID=UPI00390C3F7F